MSPITHEKVLELKVTIAGRKEPLVIYSDRKDLDIRSLTRISYADASPALLEIVNQDLRVDGLPPISSAEILRVEAETVYLD